MDETLNKSSFESFKAADMYAFGLVVWEVARRTLTTEKVFPRPQSKDFLSAAFQWFSSDCSVRRLPTSLSWCCSTRPKLWGHASGIGHFIEYHEWLTNKLKMIILQSFKTLLITWLFQVVCVRQMRPECPPRWQSESPKSSSHLSSKISSRISSRIQGSSASLHPPRNYKKPCIHWLFSLFSSDSDFVAGSETLRTLARVVVECWHHSPPVRLTALRVKKTLAR